MYMLMDGHIANAKGKLPLENFFARCISKGIKYFVVTLFKLKATRFREELIK